MFSAIKVKKRANKLFRSYSRNVANIGFPFQVQVNPEGNDVTEIRCLKSNLHV